MLYDNDKEQKQHADAIHAIAQQYEISETQVKTLYERELMRLKPEARIKTYLAVLITRVVREILYQRLKTQH